MKQLIPEINVIEHEGEMVCDVCHEKVEFLVGASQEAAGLDKNHCKECFSRQRPEYRDAVADFSDLLNMLIEIKDRHMTVEEMHELYGELKENTEE